MYVLCSWFKESRHHLLEPLPANPRFNELAGAMMITAVRIGDLGSYRCVSRNPAGETSTTLHLILPKTKSVEAANGLEVKLDPELKVANLGSSAKFTCRIMDKSKSRTGDEARSFSGKLNYFPVQGGWGLWPTGNGKKLSSSQAQLDQATCLAVA